MNASSFVRTGNNIFYLRQVDAPKPTVSPEVTHHVMVVDRSGSLWGDIEKLKQSIEQSIAVESYTNGAVLTTLISFSTHGDVTLHWSKVPADEVMNLSNPFLTKLRSIRATFLTGISQGLNLALEHIDPTQTTGLTLFTDGYANSPSSYAEIQALDAFVKKASENPRLFMNCIGYRSWCDWPRMNAMSNALSGKTVKATSFKDVLDALKDTQTLLAGNVVPAISVEAQADGAMLMAVNRTTGQVNSSMDELTLRGVGESDDITVYAVVAAEPTYNIPKGVHVIPTEDAYLFGALATAYTSLQELRLAKEVLFASGNKTLWTEHQAAMTPSTLSAMLSDLSEWVQAGNNDNYEMGRNVRPKFNLFDLAAALQNLPPKSIGIANDEFYANYRRRSIKRVPGVREEDGSITPAKAALKSRDDRTYIRGVKFNTSDASVQLETVANVDLVDANGDIVREVSYVDLSNLKDFRSYTMISSGERNVEVLALRVFNEAGWNALTPFLIPSIVDKGFTPGMKVRLELKRFRLDADSCPSADELLAAAGNRDQATAYVKALSAMQDKGAASQYSADQVEALKELHLTQALYFSPPTTNHFTDRDDAIAKGEIDSYTRYKIFFGTVEILNAGEFKSGNAFLKKRFAVTASDGTRDKKPKLANYQNGDTYAVKPPGRGAWTAADNLMSAAFDEILLGDHLTNDQVIARLKDEQGKVDAANALFQGLVMEIGCTGLLPRDLEKVMTRYEPDDFAAKFGRKLKKAEKEGIFYVADNGLVISILPETSWYTVSVPEAGAAK